MGVRKTDDRKVNNIFWRKHFSTEIRFPYKVLTGFVWFINSGTYKQKWKENILEKVVFLVRVFLKKSFWHCCDWEYRVPKIEKKNSYSKTFLFTENYSVWKTLWKVCYKGSMGHKSLLRVIITYISKKEFIKTSLMGKLFQRTLLSLGVQRTDQWKEKFYFEENSFFHWILISAK